MFLRLLNKLGLRGATVVITAAVILISLVFALAVNSAIGRQITRQTFLVSALVPLVVAAPLIYSHFSLMKQLFDSREAVSKGEMEMRSLVNNIPGMVYHGKPDWSAKIISNSKAICGYSESEINSMENGWIDIVVPEDKGALLEESRRLAEVGSSSIHRYRIIAESGEVRWVEDRKKPVFSEDGKFKGVDGIAFDITPQVEAERELLAAKDTLESQNKELEKLGRMKEGLIRDVSHELKTPVAKHNMQLEILKLQIKKHGLVEAVGKTLESMEGNIRRQEAVIRNLLDLFHLESGGRNYKAQEVDLRQLVETVIEDHRFFLEHYDIETSVDIPALHIESDHEMLRHLLSNIFSNSIKYRRKDVRSRIAASGEVVSGKVVIRVVDNGMGLREQDRRRAFERFFQARASDEGSGVGLSISKMIAEGLGGDLAIDSEGENHGATVTLTLPMKLMLS